MERARNRRIKVCEEVVPEGFAKEILDGLKRSMEINGRQSIPEVYDSGEVRVVGEVGLRGRCFSFSELDDLVAEETKVMKLEIGK